MGLIKAALGAAGGALADQWKEYFYCEALPADTLAVKGQKRTSGRSSNTKGSDNIISNGSVIAVADGQCMIIVEQGKVVDACAEPGEFTYDASTEPSVFCGDLSQTIPEVLKTIGKRFTFGGEAPKDQRIYYFNTKEVVGNKYGTPSPVPFRVVDKNVGLDVDISIRCFGEYSYRIIDPVLFYTNVCGNVDQPYNRSEIDGQLKTELLTALQPAFAKISDMGIRYSSLPGHTVELADALNEVLSKKWSDLRGIKIVSFGVSSVKASDEDEQMIKDLQKNAAFRDPTMAAANLAGAQANAMKNAASNPNGAMNGFVGMGMAQNAGGMNTQGLYQMGAQQKAAQPEGWTCSCGQTGNTGKFCQSCGKPKPEENSWTCSKCGTKNTGKFCSQCGAEKPSDAQVKCSKCGWIADDPNHLPKFCPQCGSPFPSGDQK